ncbi:hypothetical protein R3P38DRAFT_539410 [Favolaschia claudopus]|uniref:F-box domain-containing protein n=1 Tax=Favolaschia claudopus TaxID=2862362 RepID=A0AAW0CGJ0_9AGAR
MANLQTTSNTLHNSTNMIRDDSLWDRLMEPENCDPISKAVRNGLQDIPGLITQLDGYLIIPANRKLCRELQPLFDSNDLLRDAQIATVKNFAAEQDTLISETEKQLDILEPLLLRLKLEVKETLRYRARLIENLNELSDLRRKCSGVLSPIRQLPPEIIREIFNYLAPTLKNNHRLEARSQYMELLNPPPPRTEIPWFLGQICSRWRKIALGMRPLWSLTDMTQPTSSHHREECRPLRPDEDEMENVSHSQLEEYATALRDCMQPRLEWVEECLERVRDGAMVVRVAYYDDDHTVPLYKLIQRYSHRWAHLELADIPEWHLANFFRSFADSEWRLRSLALDFSRLLTTHRLDSLTCPPSLTRLRLDEVELTRNSVRAIPWEQLVHYSEANCLWPDSQDRCAHYARLVSVTHLCLKFAQEPLQPRPMRLPVLRHVWLSCQGTQALLLAYLDTPVLETLVYIHRNSANPVPSYLALPSSLSHLKILRLEIYDLIHPVDKTAILRGSPLLTEFFLFQRGHRLCDLETLLTTVEDGNRQPLGANLEVIRFGWDPEKSSGFDRHGICHEVARLIRARAECGTVSRIREFTLYDQNIHALEDHQDACFRWHHTEKAHKHNVEDFDESASLGWGRDCKIFARSPKEASNDIEEGHFCSTLAASCLGI